MLRGAATNRHAADPLNAILNYGYKLAEAEACTALLAVGLDPGLGWGHADRPGRPAAALDLMEASRGVVEEVAWRLVVERTFHKADFREDHAGQVWLRPPFSHHLADQLMPALADRLAPVVEELAHRVVNAPLLANDLPERTLPAAHRIDVPTPLTNGKRKLARRSASVSGGRSRLTDAQNPRQGRLPVWSCPGCGEPVMNARHVLCHACQEKAGHTAAVRKSRGKAIAARKRELKERLAAFGTDIDPIFYRENIWPMLGEVKLAELVEATGYSKGYCSNIRSGKWTPNVSTWPGLAALVGVQYPVPDATTEANVERK